MWLFRKACLLLTDRSSLLDRKQIIYYFVLDMTNLLKLLFGFGMYRRAAAF